MQFSVILRRRSRRRIISPAAAGRRKKILRSAQDDRGEVLRRTESEMPSGGQSRKYHREDSVGNTLGRTESEMPSGGQGRKYTQDTGGNRAQGSGKTAFRRGKRKNHAFIISYNARLGKQVFSLWDGFFPRAAGHRQKTRKGKPPRASLSGSESV